MSEVLHDTTYQQLAAIVLHRGSHKDDRTGTGTTSIFGYDMRFNLKDNIIPLLTTKKMHIPSIVHELLWYISGSSNVKYLQDNGVRIWNEWADDDGDLGPVYGHQWRNCPDFTKPSINYQTAKPTVEYPHVVDQLQNVINTLRTNPNDRRMIVNAWNVAQIPEMNLPPCHYTFQFYVNDGKLSCKLTQRSCDVFLGVPFNISQYSILTCMMAQITGFEPGELIWSGGDVHIYDNHQEQVKTQLERSQFPSPTLVLNPNIKEIDDFKFEDISISNYQSHDAIKAKVAI